MKKFLILCIGVFGLSFLTSCDTIGSSRKELFEITDYFVDQLSTVYQSYGLQGLSEKRTTKDYKYSVTPMGRLIIVKIEEYATSEEYEALRKALEKHYKNDRRVNNVYINQGGTVVIDCRN
jgi:hypothetical protein